MPLMVAVMRTGFIPGFRVFPKNMSGFPDEWTIEVHILNKGILVEGGGAVKGAGGSSGGGGY